MLQGTEYEEHGNLYAGKKLSQESTNEVVGWYQEGKEKGIPQHILGKPLNKSTYIESLQDKLYTLEELEQGGCYLEDTTDDKITSLSKAFKEPKSSVEEMMQNVDSVIDDTTLNLIDIRETLDNLRASKFSFEMMPKDDPRNAIAGLTIADCCATVTGTSYGRDIARHTITDPNYQNIHIIDEVGKSAGKATLYVDKDSNTLLLNSIELRKKYRKGENDAGRYDSSPMSKPATDREQIFQTIIYGVHAYIIEHNQQNPNQPIQQVNVGWNFNRLKEQTERYDKVEKDSDEFITPPDDFVDASLEQYVIYRRGDKLLIPEIKTPKQNMETQDEDDYQLTKGGK